MYIAGLLKFTIKADPIVRVVSLSLYLLNSVPLFLWLYHNNSLSLGRNLRFKQNYDDYEVRKHNIETKAKVRLRLIKATQAGGLRIMMMRMMR